MMEEEMKDDDVQAAEEESSSSRGLTRSDRLLFKALFGYVKVKQLMDLPVKTRDQSCSYVAKMLWPENEDDDDDDGVTFDLQTLISERSIPKIFDSNINELKIMFEHGRHLNDLNQSGFIRAFTVRDKK